MKGTHYSNHLRVNISVIFNTFTMYKPSHLVPKHFHHPRNDLVPIKQLFSPILLLPQALVTASLLSVSRALILDILQKWTHM